MSLVWIVLVLLVVGLLLWVVLTYVPLAPPFPQLITGVVVLVTVLWLLQVFGVLGALPRVRAP